MHKIRLTGYSQNSTETEVLEDIKAKIFGGKYALMAQEKGDKGESPEMYVVEIKIRKMT